MKKIAIMQPYFFPYAGYYKLIKQVDVFVFFDDVQYKKRSWINRNKICYDNPFYLTIPIKKCKQNTLINQIEVNKNWINLHLKHFLHLYGNKIEKNNVYEYYKTLDKYKLLNEILCESLIFLSNYFNFKTKFYYSSSYPSDKKGQNRIIELCDIFQATDYYNLPNGKTLYEEKEFLKNNVYLNFIDTSDYKKISILEDVFNENTDYLRF
jgi:hypothetical protein